MAASTESHVEGLQVEIIVGSYEHVLFGYSLLASNDKAVLNLSFTDKSHCASIRSLAVSSNKLLASGSADETIQLFDLKTRHEAGTLMKHNGTVTHIEFFDEFMISSDDSGMICIWKILGRSYECVKTLTGHKGSVLSASVHPSGKLLLSVGHDKTLRTWNLITGKRAYTTNTQYIVDIIKWSPNGEKYILCYNGKLDVCLVTKAAPVHSVKLPGKAHSLAFISMNILAIGCEGGTVAFLDVDSGSLIHKLSVDCNRVKCVSAELLDGNKALLALITNDGLLELHLIEAHSGTVTTSLVAASKTVLRPVCMHLVAHSETQENQDSEKPASLSETMPATSKGKKKRKQITNTSEENIADLPKKVKKDLIDTQSDSPSRENPKSSKDTVGDIQTSGSAKSKKMDRIKRALTSKSKTGEDKDGQRQKKHIKPVDSVKIAKQKMSSQQKQQHAKHHHIVEEETTSTST